MVKGDIAKPPLEAVPSMKKKKGLKPLTAGMRARESDERKDLLRNRIELKRLQSIVDKLRLDLQGLGEGSRKKETPIDPRFRLKGAARAALSTYLPPEPEFIPPPNLLDEQKGKIWFIEPKGREFLNALYTLANFLHGTLKKSRDAIECYKEILEHDEQDHLHVRTRIFQCYLDKGDTKSAQEYLAKLQQQPQTSNEDVAETIIPSDSVQHGYHNVLVHIRHQHRILSQQKSTEMNVDDLLVPSVIEVIDTAVNENEYLLWMLAYSKCFSSFWSLSESDLAAVTQSSNNHAAVSALLAAWNYHKGFGSLWEGTMVTPPPVVRTKVEKLSKQPIDKAATEPVYEPSVFEEVLQEYVVEKVLSPPVLPSELSSKGQKKKDKSNKNRNTADATNQVPVSESESSLEKFLNAYRVGLQELETTLTAE